MAEKEKQHYIPQCYLKNYSFDKKIDLISVRDFSILYGVPYKNQFRSKYYYGKDLTWENRLSELEAQWSLIFDKIAKNDCYCLCDKDESYLRLFSIYQRMRTIGFNEFVNAQHNQIAEETYRFQMINEGYDENSINHFLATKEKETYVSPSDNLNISKRIESSLDDLKMGVIKYSTDTKLVASDDPVIMINNFFSHAIGYSCMGLIVFFPITSNKLVILYDSKIYNKFHDKKYITLDNEKDVRIINDYQYVNARSFALKSPVDNFNLSTSQKKNIIKMRNITLKQNAASALGSEKQKMIIVEPKKTYNMAAPSFAAILPKAKNIPWVFRENLPRFFDKGYEDKLLNKHIFLTTIRNPLKNKGEADNTSVYAYNNKQIVYWCKEMHRFAKRYWNDEL